MIRITVDFRVSRASVAGKDGKVYFRLSGPSSSGGWGKACFNAGLSGRSREIIEIRRDEIVEKVWIVGGIVEELADGGETITVERVAKIARRRMMDCYERDRKLDKPILRGDLVKVAPPFYNEFLFVSNPVSLPNCTYKGLLEYIVEVERRCRVSGYVSSTRGYSSLRRKLEMWRGNYHIPWKMINKDMVVGFASWLNSGNLKQTTQSFYLRKLRTLLFKASSQGICAAKAEWFEAVDTSVMKRKRLSDAVAPDRNTLCRIASLDTEGEEWMALARDMFMFAFYCEGMELVDVAYLTSENIEGRELVFRRRRVGREVRLRLPREARAILRRYKGSCEFLFPLLGGGVLFASRRGRVALLIKEIGRRVGCPGLTFSSNIVANRCKNLQGLENEIEV